MSIPVIKFLFQADWQILEDALRLGSQQNTLNYSTANEMLAFFSTSEAGLIISSLKSKDDLIQLTSFIKLSKKLSKDIIFKIVVVNFTGEKQVEKAIEKLGILDVVDPGLNAKALRYKLDFCMRSINAQLKKSKADKQSQADSNSNSSQEKRSSGQMINWTPPLDHEDDLWIIKNDQDCKKILSRWLVKVLGPGPFVGQWVEAHGRRDLWRFSINPDAKEVYLGREGDWFFKGDHKPEFIWQENLWLITGSEFELYYAEEEKRFSRLKLAEKTISIAKNSTYALAKEMYINESFNKEYLLKAHRPSEIDDFIDEDHLNYNSLKGKGHRELFSDKEEGPKAGPIAVSKSFYGPSKPVRESNVFPIEEKRKDKKEENELEASEELLRAATDSALVSALLTQNDKVLNACINDFFENTIIFSSSSDEISLGAIWMDLNFNFQGSEKVINFKGEVTSIDLDIEGTKYVHVLLENEDVLDFDEFMKLYAIRQQNVSVFLKHAKGY